MANVVLNAPYNLLGNRGYYEATEQNLISASPTLLVFRSDENTIQNYAGVFQEGANGDLTPNSLLTGFTELLPNGSLWWAVSGINVPYSVYSMFADQNNGIGLYDYALAGQDSFTGSAQGDTIWGFAGNDTVYGNGGADLINGNMGSDFVQGNAGNDDVSGGKDNDTVHGGQGNDLINGNNANDWVYGDAGDDTVRGGADNDTVSGGDGNDVVYGDKGNDQLYGNAGADTFVFASESGQDTIMDYDMTDHIQIQLNINNSGIFSFADIQQKIIIIGNNTQIDLGTGHSLTISGITNLDSSDFIFA